MFWRTMRALLAASIFTAVVYTVVYWHHVRNEFFVLLGNRNEGGGWYGFHSGMGGAAYVTIPVLGTLWYWHHTCHQASCLRWGKYEAAGGVFKLCRHHHPDMRGRKPSSDVIRKMHEEWKKLHV